jgi:menaquinol-cytochrome c reductase cytochrome b/c subunit
MAAANTTPVAASRAVEARKRRQREEELLVWPDLVFIEFISAVLFTVLIVILSVLVDAILLDRANPAVTPNPSKAPWYFLNLQELLLHMHPALAGVIVPTIALIALGAIPYYDNTPEGQGEWLSTPRAWLNMYVGAATGFIGTLLLILFDDAQHAKIYERFTGADWPIPALRNLRAIQNEIPWPESWTRVPLGDTLLRTDLLGLPKISLNVNIPGLIVEQIIPVTVMVGLPILLSIVAWKTKIAQTRRDHMILQFSGFIAVYVILTIIGTYVRGEGLELVPYTIFAGDH